MINLYSQFSNFKSERGSLLIPIIVFSSVAIVIIVGIMNWLRLTIEANRQLIIREKAIQLAESGIDYYRWHLAHDGDDYEDGTGGPGPYLHYVYDKDGNIVGEFSLSITPPPDGSTKVVIESTGTPASSTISRIIKVEMAIPSLAKYAVAANDIMRFGEGTEVFGPIHSNYGIRFDGLAHNIVTSSVSSYDDPDHDDSGAEKYEFGVHTHVVPPPGSGIYSSHVPAEQPPNSVPSRTDVFEVGRQFPVPVIDFVGITNDLAEIKTNAQASGVYFAPSGYQGYQLIFQTDNTFNAYRVTSQSNTSSSCRNNSSSSSQPGWNSWSINNKTYLGNYAIPTNGLIFVEDNTWVEGQINGARVTIAAGRFPDNPSSRPQIVVNNDLMYTSYDGSDVIALISQGNVTVGLVSDTILRIDGSLVAQNGSVGRYYYASACGSTYLRNSVTLYGMIATNKRYGFSWSCSGVYCSGYDERYINYDAHLLYGPPPSFPLTSDQYEILSWEEI